MHIMEAIGIQESKNMSTVAKTMSVTVGTLTIAINHLVKKGYVERTRSEEDRRVVLVSLSEKGEKAYLHHKIFHEKMVMAVLDSLKTPTCRAPTTRGRCCASSPSASTS